MDINITNLLTLKSINELFKHHFLIPSYQRGYRWTKTQVTRLLDDILQFSNKSKKTDGEFYCLQPIVVKKTTDGNYEVIDGQQRLTTVFLILKYLEDIIKTNYPKFSFTPPVYDTKTDISSFLKNVSEKTVEEAMGNIDFYHIWNAYNTIKKWFSSEDKDNIRPDYVKTLLSHTGSSNGENIIDGANNIRVIWYEVEETKGNDSIDIFTRLNIGKIPLTNAELVRALFLQKENFADDNAELKQLQIASEWDVIEKALQNDEFWFFIYNTKNPIRYDNRIEYIFDLMKGRTKECEEYFTFYEFIKDFPANNRDSISIDRVWLKIKEYFLTFEAWHDNYELYHYIGYLIDSIDKGDSDAEHTKNIIKTISSLKRAAETESKTDFINSLKNEIRNHVNCDLDKLGYGNKDKVRKVLLLFNIQTVLETQKSDMRFPFHKYKFENWDIEHVCSLTDNKITTPMERKQWIEDIFEYFTGEKELMEVKNYIADGKLDKDEDKVIKAMCNTLIRFREAEKIEKEEFDAVFKEMQKYFKEDDQLDNRDDISNLALLDYATNRSYGNSFFPIKRKRIISNDKKGIFTPIATKNLFLKYYSSKQSDIMYWTKDDAGYYRAAIKETLADF